MDTDVIVKRKRFEADDGDQKMNLGNVQEPGIRNLEQLHVITKVQKKKIRWADIDDSDEEDLQWSADTTQLTIAGLACEEPTRMEEHTYEDDGIEFCDDETGKQLNNEKVKNGTPKRVRWSD